MQRVAKWRFHHFYFPNGFQTLVTVPAGRQYVLMECNLDACGSTPLTAAIFLQLVSTTVTTDVFTVTGLGNRQSGRRKGWWVLHPGDQVSLNFASGNCVAVHVSGFSYPFP